MCLRKRSNPDDDVLARSRIVQLEPGDYIAIITPDEWSGEDLQRAADQVRAAWPGVRFLFFTNGVDIQVMREEYQ